MNNPFLLSSLRFTPIVAERLACMLDPKGWDERPDPERLTLREAIAHLAEGEQILRGRIKTAVEDSGATIYPYDPLELAREKHYGQSDVFEQLNLWKQEREKTITYLETISGSAWENFGVHQRFGRMTAADIASMLTSHDLYHIGEFLQYLPN